MMPAMDECCAVIRIAEQQRRVFRIVLWINATMFLVEAVTGILSNSTALLADSVDMLGDAIVYGVSLYAVGRGSVWQGRAALLKVVSWPHLGLACWFKLPSRWPTD
jgi:Co/Zn/Cd efflux system component